MVKINKPLPSTSTAVEYMLTRLSRFCGGNERGFWINQNSVSTLENLAKTMPKQSLPLLRGLLRLANPAINLCGLEVPAEMTEEQNLPFMPKLGKKGEMARLIDHNWRLDLGLFTIKKEAKIEFDGEAYLAEVRATYNKKDNPLAHEKMEIGDQVLYQNLLDILDKLYDFEMIRVSATREGKAELEKKAWEGLAVLARCIREMLQEEGFPFSSINYRLLYKEKLDTVAKMLEMKIPGAAETALVALIIRMEEDLERSEMARISEQKKAAIMEVKSDDQLLRMGMEFFKIRMEDDGNIIVPQRGFSKKGGVLIKELRDHKVAPEVAVRQQQHEIDNIKENIRINTDFINALNAHAGAIREGKVDYHRLLLDTAAAVVEYENGKLQVKRNTARRLNRVLEKVKTAFISTSEKTRARQLRFAVSVMGIAADELRGLNPELERQASIIMVRKRVLELITDKIFMRNFKINEFANKAVEKLQQWLSPGNIWPLVREANALLEEYKPDDQSENGLKVALKKLKQLSNDLAAIGRLLDDRKKTGEAIADARKELAIGIARAKALRTSYEAEMIAALKRSSVSRMRFILKKLRNRSLDISAKAYWAIREALLIRHYVEKSGQAEDKGKDSAYLSENHDRLLERVKNRDQDFLPVVSKERDKADPKKTIEIEIGEALPRDISRYKLNKKTV